ncbi:MAG: RnfH family protein [Rubrivivax sp.]
MSPHSGAALRVEVIHCPRPGVNDCVALQLPQPATVLQALHASGLVQRHSLDIAGLVVGIWNKHCTLESPLRDGDRVEIHRPLQVDPKEARRQRHRRNRN